MPVLDTMQSSPITRSAKPAPPDGGSPALQFSPGKAPCLVSTPTPSPSPSVAPVRKRKRARKKESVANDSSDSSSPPAARARRVHAVREGSRARAGSPQLEAAPERPPNHPRSAYKGVSCHKCASSFAEPVSLVGPLHCPP